MHVFSKFTRIIESNVNTIVKMKNKNGSAHDMRCEVVYWNSTFAQQNEKPPTRAGIPNNLNNYDGWCAYRKRKRWYLIT